MDRDPDRRRRVLRAQARGLSVPQRVLDGRAGAAGRELLPVALLAALIATQTFAGGSTRAPPGLPRRSCALRRARAVPGRGGRGRRGDRAAPTACRNAERRRRTRRGGRARRGSCGWRRPAARPRRGVRRRERASCADGNARRRVVGGEDQHRHGRPASGVGAGEQRAVDHAVEHLEVEVRERVAARRQRLVVLDLAERAAVGERLRGELRRRPPRVDAPAACQRARVRASAAKNGIAGLPACSAGSPMNSGGSSRNAPRRRDPGAAGRPDQPTTPPSEWPTSTAGRSSASSTARRPRRSARSGRRPAPARTRRARGSRGARSCPVELQPAVRPRLPATPCRNSTGSPSRRTVSTCSPHPVRDGNNGGMRFVVLALAPCWSAPPSPSRRSRRRPPRRRRHRRPRRSRPRSRRPPSAGRPARLRRDRLARSRALGQPARGAAGRRRPAPRARRGLLHLGPDLQPDPEPRVAPLGHRPADPHRAARSCTSTAPTRDGAQRVGIMDLSRTHGGRSAQLRRARPRVAPERARRRHPLSAQGRDRGRAIKPSQVDRELAQDLVDRFVAAGAVKVFVGPHLHLKGPKNVVVPLIYHDDHLHVRIR